MSKLDDLIKEKCPNGVKYEYVGSIADVGTGSSNGNEAIDNGEYPFFVRSQTVKAKNDYEYDEEAIIIPGEGGIGDIYHYVNGKYALHQRVYRIHFKDDRINTRFMYYCFSAFFKRFILKKAVSATVTSIRKPMIEKFEVPVPPLEVQNEIVQILDNFAELTAELTAELSNRKKQYEYYRDLLLNFDETEQRERVKWLTIGEIGDIKMCKRILNSQTNSTTGIPFYKIGTFGGVANSYISEETFEEYKKKYSFPKKGDVLISAAGTIGRTVIYDGEPAYFQDSNNVWLEHDESLALNKYLYYYYQLSPWQVSTGGTIARLYNDNILKAKIAVPPIAEQKRIIYILDNFSALASSISEGLPAEIEAREKQYAYYRDKLLSFKELVSNA